jgi:hypothetical protein
MDVTTSAFSFTQVILAWTLLGLLLTWLITFSVLALRSFFTKKAEWEDTLTLSGAFPALSIYTQKHAVGTALISAHRPAEVLISSNSTENEEKGSSRDTGSAHIM